MYIVLFCMYFYQVTNYQLPRAKVELTTNSHDQGITASTSGQRGAFPFFDGRGNELATYAIAQHCDGFRPSYDVEYIQRSSPIINNRLRLSTTSRNLTNSTVCCIFDGRHIHMEYSSTSWKAAHEDPFQAGQTRTS